MGFERASEHNQTGGCQNPVFLLEFEAGPLLHARCRMALARVLQVKSCTIACSLLRVAFYPVATQSRHLQRSGISASSFPMVRLCHLVGSCSDVVALAPCQCKARAPALAAAPGGPGAARSLALWPRPAGRGANCGRRARWPRGTEALKFKFVLAFGSESESEMTQVLSFFRNLGSY
jgi:hypothetical protein